MGQEQALPVMFRLYLQAICQVNESEQTAVTSKRNTELLSWDSVGKRIIRNEYPRRERDKQKEDILACMRMSQNCQVQFC